MARKISRITRKELVEGLRQRYVEATRKEKTRILDEFVAIAGYHRKHAVRLIGRGVKLTSSQGRSGNRIYDEAVREALIVTWEAADRICGKRLKAVLPNLVRSMERHGHLHLDPVVRERLLAASAATIDRLLIPIRDRAKPRKKRPASRKKVSKDIRVRTFADWKEPPPGYLEIDFVEHNGGSTAGAYVHTLDVTDVCSGWTEFVPLLAREQSLVVEALEVLRNQLPFTMLGIDSDNDSAFINDTLLDFCKRHDVEFTRSRAYRKNDQAWIEQKNGAIIRRFVGYERYTGVVAGQALANLYQAVRLYVNFFQPSFKLREKIRIGAKVKRLYHSPATPCDRLLAREEIDAKFKEKLRVQHEQLDPVALLHHIRDAQAALVALVSPENSTTGPGRKNLEQFLAQLPQLWRDGDARPTHRKAPAKQRDWRTRKNPFESVWPDVLLWLQDEPDVTAKELFGRLQHEHPGRFSSGQLRTLQRRVQEWRKIMARQLVYSGMYEPPGVSADVIG